VYIDMHCVRKTSTKLWIGNVILTSQCDVTNSAHPLAAPMGPILL